MAYRGKIQLTATERLLRPYFGMHCFEWPDDPGVEFHLGFGDWVRLLRANGFEVIDFIEVQAPVGGDRQCSRPRRSGMGAKVACRADLEGPQGLLVQALVILRRCRVSMAITRKDDGSLRFRQHRSAILADSTCPRQPQAP
jgi:hypothetical protein